MGPVRATLHTACDQKATDAEAGKLPAGQLYNLNAWSPNPIALYTE
jgi:hypothetical protein